MAKTISAIKPAAAAARATTRKATPSRTTTARKTTGARATAKKTTAKATKAAIDFESFFISNMLHQMRETTRDIAPDDSPFKDKVNQDMQDMADKLLGQGEVAEACTRGEEAKRMSPRLPSVYKFLGKCYMRAGRAQQANDNYKKYLELAPNATDAPFVKSMIK